MGYKRVGRGGLISEGAYDWNTKSAYSKQGIAVLLFFIELHKNMINRIYFNTSSRGLISSRVGGGGGSYNRIYFFVYRSMCLQKIGEGLISDTLRYLRKLQTLHNGNFCLLI